MLPRLPFPPHSSLIFLVCVLTFLHFTAEKMRGPILPLYAAAHGATATSVGFVVAAYMAAAAVGSLPLGRAADVWGRRPLLLGGMAAGIMTSLLLPLVEGELALMTVYGLAGLGVAAFTPSVLSLVSDAAAQGAAGRAFAWYTTAHYGAIGFGPFLGGLVAELGLANTAARFPAGWLADRTGRWAPYAIGGVLGGSVATALLPHVSGHATLLVLAVVFGAVSGTAGVATGVALAASTTPATGGLIMGGYSTALYLGLALGSFALGPVITHKGHAVGFGVGAAAGVLGALVAALLWAKGSAPIQTICQRVAGRRLHPVPPAS